MSETSIQQVVEDLGRKAQAALAPPGPAERELDELLARIESQPGLSAPVRREARRALEGDRKVLREGRLAELGAELRRVLKPLGLEITARVGRRRRTRATPPTSAPTAEPAHDVAGQAKGEGVSW